MFKNAEAVYANSLSEEMNTRIVLFEEIDSLLGCNVLISASSFYKLYINEQFVGFGPARTARGYARADSYDASPFNREGKNIIKIEVVGYCCRSYAFVKQPSFVVCEVSREEEVLLYTGRDFDCYVDTCHIQKTRRFSGQRGFTEVRDLGGSFIKTELSPVASPLWLENKVPSPEYKELTFKTALSGGSFVYDPAVFAPTWKFDGGDAKYWGSFDEGNLQYEPYIFVKSLIQKKTFGQTAFPKSLKAGEYVIVDLEKIEVGFVQLLCKAKEKSEVILAFSEYLTSDIFDFGNLYCENVLEFISPKGEHKTESFDIYGFRYLAVFVKCGEISLDSVGIRTCQFDERKIKEQDFGSDKLNAIYTAAANTFAHNAVDIYMDCPSRERAGWLCDSYFTAKAEYFLTGDCLVESTFLENYRLFKNEGELPKGALPKCYPSDTPLEAKFIPQWNMWYVLEVEEFLCERSPDTDKELFRESVMGFIDFLSRYENADGLLERLPEWNFVEWSKANDWVLDVNYPTNFLYSEVLDAAYRLYGDVTLKEKAEKVRETAKKLSFNGEVFTDNAERDENGVLKNTGNISEACQYYAYLYGKADIDADEYAKLKLHILDGFNEFEKGCDPEKYTPVNAFIGFYLRMMVLLDRKEHSLLLRDIEDFFYEMATTTGTLWEYKDGFGSRDHGFTSFAAYVIDKATK